MKIQFVRNDSVLHKLEVHMTSANGEAIVFEAMGFYGKGPREVIERNMREDIARDGITFDDSPLEYDENTEK